MGIRNSSYQNVLASPSLVVKKKVLSSLSYPPIVSCARPGDSLEIPELTLEQSDPKPAFKVSLKIFNALSK
jgi:hypothetical protein